MFVIWSTVEKASLAEDFQQQAVRYDVVGTCTCTKTTLLGEGGLVQPQVDYLFELEPSAEIRPGGRR